MPANVIPHPRQGLVHKVSLAAFIAALTAANSASAGALIPHVAPGYAADPAPMARPDPDGVTCYATTPMWACLSSYRPDDGDGDGGGSFSESPSRDDTPSESPSDPDPKC